MQRLVSPTFDNALGFRQSNQQSQRLIHRGRIRKHFCEIPVEKDNVRAGTVGLVMLPAHPLRKIVFGSHLVVIVWMDLWTHKLFVLGRSLLER